MKHIKSLMSFISILVGVLGASSTLNRITYTYGLGTLGTYNLLSQPYDPSKCLIPTPGQPCSYTVGTNLGLNVTKATLEANGAVAHPPYRIYTGV